MSRAGRLRSRFALAGRLVRRGDERGSSIVELSMVVPVILLLLLSMLEFGFAFDHTLTIQYATREGARMGAALGPGGGTTGVPCGNVDSAIVDAVVRVLKSPGSRVDMANVSQIRIYKANTTDGSPVAGTTNVWVPSGGTFAPQSTSWSACSRSFSSNPPDSIGVAISYRYAFRTPLGGILRFLGGTAISSLGISDKAVMALNPQN